MSQKKNRSSTPYTQADVARHCGVSRSTVAAVLRGAPSETGVNIKTHERVMRAIAELGYRPNAAAAMLRSGRTHSVAIAMPDMEYVGQVIASQIIQGIGTKAMELGYTFNIACYAKKDIRGSLQRLVRESRFDGVFILALAEKEADPRSSVLHDMGIPYIALESQVEGATTISFDNVGGGLAVTNHLLGLGYKRIAFVGGWADSHWASRRYQGYCQALKDQGLTVDPQLVFAERRDLVEMGSYAARQLVEGKVDFDAVVCVSDAMALSLIRELRKLGKRVPEDVAVTGYDNILLSSLVTPSLTTVHQDGQKMGSVAMEMLHTLINEPNKHTYTQLPVSLIVRESSGAQLTRNVKG